MRENFFNYFGYFKFYYTYIPTYINLYILCIYIISTHNATQYTLLHHKYVVLLFGNSYKCELINNKTKYHNYNPYKFNTKSVKESVKCSMLNVFKPIIIVVLIFFKTEKPTNHF